MIAIYDDFEWKVVAYLLSHMKCGEATLPKKTADQSTAIDPSIRCINPHNNQPVLHNTNSSSSSLLLSSWVIALH
jgi:hypothetical protein